MLRRAEAGEGRLRKAKEGYIRLVRLGKVYKASLDK